MNNKIIKSKIQQIHRNNFNFQGPCMAKNCRNKAIKSHSISKNELRNIAEKSKLVTLEPNFDHKCDFKEKGVNQTSVFYGFCNQHDTQFFKILDNNFSEINTELVFAQMYRITSRELYQKIAQLKSVNIDSIKKITGDINEVKVDKTFIKNFNHGSELGRKDIEKLFNLLNQNINKKDKHIVFKVYKYQNLPFTFSFAHTPFFDFNGNELLDLESAIAYGSIVIFSLHLNGSSYIILVTHKNYKEAFNKFIDSIKSEIALLNFCISSCENIFFKPSYIENLDNISKTNIKNMFGLSPLDYYADNLQLIHLDKLLFLL